MYICYIKVKIMNIKRVLFFLISVMMLHPLRADEGMWVPSYIQQKIEEMRSKGFRLSAEDLYSMNSSSLKDAIVHFNGGCTGEMISGEGLLITNHHCGYDQIQYHSSVEHDYLKDGFWAMKRDEELPNPDLYVAFLEYMEDVTKKVLSGYSESMSEEQREKLIADNSRRIVSRIERKGKGIKARVAPLYYGNQYFVYVYKVFTDVRLVGAPPSSIGKFGGDTDNWMWPRHTGDFSLFRVYADRNNEPAPYSPDNVPYRPKRFFKINAAGIAEGDFTLVYGYPGRTSEYVTSQAVDYIANVSNPKKIKLRTIRLDIMESQMDRSDAVRIQYSSKNADVANSWKKWQGEMKGILKMNTVANKRNYEKEFAEWAKGKPEYDGITGRFADLYSQAEELSLVRDYQYEALNAPEFLFFAAGDGSDSAIFYKNYYKPIDKATFIALMNEYDKDIDESYKSPYFKEKVATAGSIEKLADAIYDNDSLSLAREFYMATNAFYNSTVRPRLDSLNREINMLYRKYMRGQMEFARERGTGKVFYPDANSTLRIAYGCIKGYAPADAVYYRPFSTLDGIMEKDNPEIFDYNVPQKLREIYAAKDFGRWEENGTVPVCFIATNHTTGGNSGSPVLDAEGNLIGVNFDRVWEGTMSDIVFDPDLCRNIALDIRYALFIIDKVADAGYLLDEMVILE